MHSSNRSTKQYVTLVIDHAAQGDRQVVFEIGGGICGSGFPDYDANHLANPYDDDNMFSPMRREIFKRIANRFKKIFVVNTEKFEMINTLGHDWLQQFPGVTIFDNFFSFCDYAIKNLAEMRDAVMLIDCLDPKLFVGEEHYAAILEEMEINIPVINAGSYRFFNDKILFPQLFTGDNESMLPKTWLVNKENYQQKIQEISRFNCEYFIFKLPTHSEARDTIIADKETVCAVIQALINEDVDKLQSLSLPATKPECLLTFLKYICEDTLSFVVREVIVPDPVQLGKDLYRSAARSVWFVGYDTETQTFDFMDHIASYWQPAEKPYVSGRAITHDNLVTASTPTESRRTVLTHSIFSKGKENISPDFTEAQLQRLLPGIQNIAKVIVENIAKHKTPVDYMLKLTDQSSEASDVIPHVSRTAVLRTHACYCINQLNRQLDLATNKISFITVQAGLAVRYLRAHGNIDLLHIEIFKRFDSLVAIDMEGVDKKSGLLSIEWLALSSELRSKVKVILNELSLLHVLNYLENFEAHSSALLNDFNTKFGTRALDAYKTNDFGTAVVYWEKLLTYYQHFWPLSEHTIEVHFYLFKSLQNLKMERKSQYHYSKALSLCKITNRHDLIQPIVFPDKARSFCSSGMN